MDSNINCLKYLEALKNRYENTLIIIYIDANQKYDPSNPNFLFSNLLRQNWQIPRKHGATR
jgi:hypothetical protein